MTIKRYKSLAEQVADEIRIRIHQRQWTGFLPGRQKLAVELGVNHKTCNAALKLLEMEGLLLPQGSGLRRVIAPEVRTKKPAASLRIRVLMYEKSDLRSHILLELLRKLREMGHDVNCTDKTLSGMGMSLKRIIRHVNECEADAWIVMAGSYEVLNWFAQQSFPAFALFGRVGDAGLSSIIPNKAAAIDELVTRLVQWGHQRIVLITRADRSQPYPGGFVESLARHGIATSDYNFPKWDTSPDGMTKLMESLFHYTPPTALILNEAPLFIAAMQWLSRIGLSAPKHVSLACMDPSSAFEWCRPEITHIEWDATPLINRIVGWVNSVGNGKDDRRKTTSHAKLVPGGTIGPAPSGLKPVPR